MYVYVYFFFFFSSRRRHTRSLRDWSSDVCSSDLRLTRGPKRDPGWNMPVVEKAIKWAEEETSKLMGTNWTDYWNPERYTERIRENSGFYASDLAQTIDVLDFYFWDDSDNQEGWRRKI